MEIVSWFILIVLAWWGVIKLLKGLAEHDAVRESDL